jgi:hypothetical protein
VTERLERRDPVGSELDSTALGRYISLTRTHESRVPMSDRREARLRPEFAALYPGLRPDVWYSAAWLSARQFARTRCDGVATEIASVLSDQHFEFRGGRPRRLRAVEESASELPRPSKRSGGV